MTEFLAVLLTGVAIGGLLGFLLGADWFGRRISDALARHLAPEDLERVVRALDQK